MSTIMNLISIECIAEERKEKLLPLLKGNIFHVTSLEALDMIVKEGIIRNNKDGEMNYTYPQSKISYGNMQGFVCLFDFRDIEASDICWTSRKYSIFGRNVFLLLRNEYWVDVIKPKDRHLGPKEMYIPESEVWYPGDNEITKIKTCIRVTNIAK